MRQNKHLFLCCTFIAAMFAFLLPSPVLAQDNADVFELDVQKKNATTVTQETDGSWTIATTGNDPYVATSRLMRNLTEAETTLTFEYKASEDAQLEIFFSRGTSANSYATGYSYNLGIAPQAEEWTRVNIDITKARTLWGWGNAGQTLRIDPGTAADLTFCIRDLRVTSDAAGDAMKDFTLVDGAIQINTQDDFDKWIAGFKSFVTSAFIADVNVVLNTDVTATSTTGCIIPRFNAVFDGNGHNLDVSMDYFTADANKNAGNSFFSEVYGTIKNLTVSGTVSGNPKFMSSVARAIWDGAVLENITSYVNIISSITGDGTHGGIVGCCYGNSTLRNICFAGTMSGENTNACGGLVGWVEVASVFENCLMIGDITVDHTSGNSIGRNAGKIYGTRLYASSKVGDAPASCTIVTPAQLESGEVCFALNGNQQNIAWYQNIGEDPVPVLDKSHKQVYSAAEMNCAGVIATEGATFSNDACENHVADHEYICGVCSVCGMTKENFIQQDAEGFFIVDTPEKLVYIANYATLRPKTNIRITKDLDMAEVSEHYNPIRGAYSGTFDGQGHTISNFIINRPTEKDQALIGQAGGCTVKNLTLDSSCSIEGGAYSAGFVGETTGTVTITMEGLVMHGNVRAHGANAGGIYACNMSSTATVIMTNCGVSGHIHGDTQSGALTGWFGQNKATVTNCWFVGQVDGADNTTTGIFARPTADVAFNNCWSILGDRGGVGKLSEDAATSGELAFKLNGNQKEITWYQNLGEDAYPVMDNTHKQVYSDGSFDCGGNALSEATSYSNEGESSISDHEYTNGICDNCGHIQEDFVQQDKFGWYIIDTPEKYIYMAKFATKNPTVNMKITADLDMSEVNDYFEPIRGTFAGTLDGCGHTISNLVIDRPEGRNMALIGLAGACTVKNLTIDNTCSIVGGGYSAGFVGETTGSGTITFENLFMHADVTCNGANGASIYACNMGSTMTIVMKNCGTTGNVYGGKEAGSLSGWLGADKATLTNCWSVGTVEFPRAQDTYFVAPAGVSFKNCYSAFGSRSNVGKVAEDAAASGELTWKLNGSKFTNPTWYQNLSEGDVYPSLDSSRGVVYKTTDGYATLFEDNAESMQAFIDANAATGRAYLDTEDAQNYANVDLLAEYTALVEAYESVTDMASFLEAFNAEQAKYKEVTASVKAYKNYEAAVNEIIATLEGRDDFSGDDRDFLESVYLGENAAPGTYEAAPNGTYEYIMETRTLATADVNAEIEYVKELFRIAVANGYEPGTDITNLITNVDFSDGWNGWSQGLYSHGATNTEGSTMRAAEVWSANNYNMYQDIVVAKAGVYELQMRGAYRPFDQKDAMQYSPYFYMNDNANYLQTLMEDYMPIEDAIDGVNCNITGSVPDYPLTNEDGDTIGYAMHGVLSCCKAFEAGRHDNRLVINVEEGDTIRLGLKQTYFGVSGHDWLGIGDIHLTYHGTLEESEEAIDRALASMLARANTLQTIQVASDADYVKYPNYSQSLKDRLATAIANAEAAADAAAKYAVVEELSAIFKEILDSKFAYKAYFAKTEDVMDVFYKGTEYDEALNAEWGAKANEVNNLAIAAYEEGTISTQEAKDFIYINEIPAYPTVDENGVYHIANTAQMYVFTTMVNGGSTGVSAVLDGNVCLDTEMIMTEFRGTFDGQGHTMTVNINREADAAAPFEKLYAATVKNMVVEGTIVTNRKFAAAVAAHAYEGCTIDRIDSRIDIQGSIAGDGTHGGILAVNDQAGTTVSNCVFSGTMSGTATMNGGIVGWSGTTLYVKNCLVIADITTGPDQTSADVIARNSRIVSDCYFLNPYGATPEGATQITPEQLANGFVAYALNGGKTRKDVVWRQNLDGTDLRPSLDPAHKIVYQKENGTYTNEIQNEIEKYSGTEEDPFIISTAKDMALLRKFMIPGRVNYVQLGADIDMAEVTSWTPLNMGGDVANGVDYQNLIDFDGKSHVISNFTCTDESTSYNSFFGILCGNVRNVGFKDVNVSCVNSGTGVLAGYMSHSQYQNENATSATSSIENVWVTGKLNVSKDYAGGLVGNVGGPSVIKNCYTNIEITSDAAYVGGIVGRVRDELAINQAYAAGSITSSSANVGGIIGGGQQPTTSPGFYNNIVVWNNTDQNFGATIAAQDVTLPTADLLDVVFDEENIAVDQSPMQQTIEVIGEPKVAYSEQWGKNVFYSDAKDDRTPISYLKVPYAENQALKDALADGFTVETTFKILNDTYPGDVTPFRATESGGYGFDVTSNGQIKFEVRSLIDGENSYRYAPTNVYAKVHNYYHMIGVYNKAENKVYCYVNGGNAANGAAAGELVFPSNADDQWLGIGADCGNTNGAKFEIISARMYNEPISEETAKALYFKELGKNFYAGDQLSNISYYNGSNFAELQQVVVDWGKPWTCDMKEGSYPVFEGDYGSGIQGVTNNVNGKIFNINGIQVEKTTKGLYIIDGKKVMVK